MIPRNTPKAPNSAAFERYGTYPVNLYTGLPTIEIPLFEFAVDDYKVPIKLTYHASGNKVADQASWVGLGWRLHTGGKVSRTVLGLPDENAGANTGPLLGRSLSAVAGVNIQNCLTPQSTSDLLFKGIAMGMDDAQRDEFMYQLPLGSNSFIMSYTAGAVFLSPEVTRIQSTPTLSSFTLVNNGGTLFEFNDTETATNNAPAYLSGWFLNRITGRNPSQQAVYAYTNMAASTSFDLTYIRTTIDQVFGTGGPGVNDGSNVVPRNNNASSSQIVPTQIDFPGGRIKFILEARTDKHRAVDYRP